MARRETGAGSKRRARAQTAAEKAAGSANLAKGRKKKAEQTKAAKAAGTPRASERWAMLLSGTITVKDLDDDEIAKMKVRGADGGFTGRRPGMPSHLVQAFHKEAITRARNQITTAAPKAAKALLKILEDPEASNNDIIKAASILMDRGMGRAPEVIRIVGESPFDHMLTDAVGLDRGSVASEPD